MEGLLNLAFRLIELCSTSAGHSDTNYTSDVNHQFTVMGILVNATYYKCDRICEKVPFFTHKI